MTDRHQRHSFPIFLLMLVCHAGWVSGAEIDPARFREDLKQLCTSPTRILGSEGYDRAAGFIEEQINALPNVEYRRHEFPVMVPVTREAVLIHGGRRDAVYPFWPAHVRVNAAPADGITGRCVYAADAQFQSIKPAEVTGQIAVIEASAGQWWTNAFYFGARAVLVLGTDDTNNFDLRTHDQFAPVNLPRFYIPPGKLADDLRAGRVSGEVTLKASVDWQRKTAVNFYALVKPSKQIANWTPKSPPSALMFSVPFDSTGLVPDLATGASQAVQAACGLALLRDLSKQPLDRPVVVFFSGGDGIQMLATRNMFMALSDVPAMWRPKLDDVAEQLNEAQRDLDRLRETSSAPAQLDAYRDRSAIDRVATLIQTDAALDQDVLFRLRRDRGATATPEQLANEKRLEERQFLLNRLRYTFVTRPSQLSGDLAAPSKAFIDRTTARLDQLITQQIARQTELQTRIDLYQWLAGAIGKQTDPGTRANDNRLIELLVALDLTDRGDRCGPMFVGRFQDYTNISQLQEYREWFSRQDRRFNDKDPSAAWWGGIRRQIDFDPFVGARSPKSWLCAPMAIGSELCQAWGVPGFSMITLDDLRLRRDTPTDTLEHVNVDAILPQLSALRDLFWKAWNDPTFRGQPEFKWQRSQFEGQVVGTAPGKPVPDLPREGFLATYYYTANNVPRIPQPKPLPWTLGVRRNEVRDTDAEGRWRFEGMPRLGGNNAATEMQIFAVQVFRPEAETGAITACSDLGKQLGDLKMYADIRQELEPMRSVAFACEEFSLAGLYDPRFLQNLGEVFPLDARRNAEPQRYNAVVHNQLMAGFVEPGSLTSLLFRYGRVGNRLILINMPSTAAGKSSQPTHAMGRGFSAKEFNEIDPLALATANDFFRLDELRLDEYRRAGVSSALIDSMQTDAGQQLDRARQAMKTDADASGLMKHATGAWANNARVYSATQAMANDVVRGAIFLLLLCVPFSFCMERLLIATPNIYKQIAGASSIFAVMTALLWSFHPAFKISSSPLIIVLAFAIILMSGLVIFVVYGRFDTELKKISSGRGSADVVNFARASVLASAVLLGIANMRKRRFRTLLTSITIVLITFAVLCFTSATRYLDTTTLPAGVSASHPGVMLRQRGYRPLPEMIVQNLRPLLPGKTIVERWWNATPADPREQINLVAGSKVVAVPALLGLSPGESKLSKIADVIGVEKFARLENGETDIVFLAKSLADELGAQEGGAIRAGGIDLQIAGVFDADAFDKSVTALTGDPLAPLKFAAGALDADGRLLSDTTAAESFSLDANAAGGELGSTYEHLSSSQFAIVPVAVSKLLPNAALRSVAFDAGDDATIKKTSDELARRFSVALFAGYSDGVRMVSASNLTSVSGAGQVAIPLMIAGLIIFNTMMGSIAERRREIHVYTSLGLAPVHVGALFVAEALTYGLIGTVFGYILGQGVGTILLKLGWLGNVTMNYSGTAAIMTMGLILLIVLLSALVPARLASKLAAPSIERSWKVPLPKDGQIEAHLPFTINKTAADGALAYLADFFDAHREGTIGKFSADKVEVFSVPPLPQGEGRGEGETQSARGLTTTVWLTPFDLGIRQQIKLLIHPGQFEDIYEVQVVLSRLSGDDGSWYRMNRTFLTELRKQFLQWRSLSPQKMLAYVEESRKLFATSP